MKNQDSDQNPKSLRISIDSKAKVKIGNLSRGGKARTLEPKQAPDHDMNWYETLVPFGILNLDTAQLSIYWGTSAETSDFIVDCLVRWWKDNQPNYPDLEEWVINLDGGPSVRSDRTQFKKRMVELSQAMGITIRLIYYPPYHSKYNAIERCWAVLENYLEWRNFRLCRSRTEMVCWNDLEGAFTEDSPDRADLSQGRQGLDRGLGTLIIFLETFGRTG